MTARPWNLRLNLDDFNGLVASVYSDYDRALILQGIALGANGGEPPDGAPPPFLKAFDIGKKMYQEAVEYQDEQSRRGRASAERRREKFGTAQPRRTEPPFEPPFEPGFEPPPEPNDNRQSTNPNPQSTELEHPPKPPHADDVPAAPNRITASDWTPLQEHRDLAAFRNADVDAQLARFRERNSGQTDTDQGWSVRFRQWLGSARPERSLPREAVASPTVEEWMEFARSVNNCGNLGKWPKESAEAGWLENQAKGWRYVTDWQADCQARAKRWAANEATQAQRRKP